MIVFYLQADVNKIAYRLRSSPYPMLSVNEANHIIEDIISSGALLKEFAEKLEWSVKQLIINFISRVKLICNLA